MDQDSLSGFSRGDYIRGYKIVRELGRGGMGTVYLAEQEEPVERKVAIKVLRHTSDSKVAEARFHLESQALAMMNHPNIASVIDAGSTPDRRLYIVMEYVQGEAILEYCDHRRLSLERRIEIFLGVLDAIQHAHQKGIIHRDVKPGNVIVCEHEGQAVPKIIDFGTAKAIDSSSRMIKHHTAEGLVVGTPMYMSPEQLTGVENQVDVRTDIYGLGMLLYELLCGVSALDTEKMSRIHMYHVILNIEPEKPSQRISKLSPEIAYNRSTDLLQLERMLRGDLDWIILKAMDKNPEQRYGSTAEFLLDLKHYLRNEPVSAGPPTASYKLRKFIKRNRLLVTFSVILVMLLVAGVFGTSIGLIQALEAKKQEEVAKRRAINTVEYLQKILASADPFRDGKKVQVQELLQKASRNMESDLKENPEILGPMRFTLGWTFLELGRYDQASFELNQAKEIQIRELGENHPDTLKTMNALGRLAYKKGDYTEASEILQENLERETNALGPENNQTLWTRYTLGKTLEKMGQHSLAEDYLRQVMDARQRALGSEHPYYLVTLNSLCLVLSEEGRYKEAEALQRHAMETLSSVLGPTHPTTLNSASNLAEILDNMERYEEAFALASKTLDQQVHVLGENHPETLATLFTKGHSLLLMGNVKEAEELLNACALKRAEVLGEKHPLTIIADLVLADCYATQGRTKMASILYEKAYSYWMELDEAQHLEMVSRNLLNYLDFLEKNGQGKKAREYLMVMDKRLSSTIEKQQVRDRMDIFGRRELPP